jgi:hypothetical protein
MRITIEADTIASQPNVTMTNSSNPFDSSVQANEGGSAKVSFPASQAQTHANGNGTHTAAQNFDTASAINGGTAPSF